MTKLLDVVLLILGFIILVMVFITSIIEARPEFFNLVSLSIIGSTFFLAGYYGFKQ